MANQSSSILNAVSTYSRELLHFIRGRVSRDEDAEDILQDVWFQLAGVADTGEIQQMSAWLYKVARNKIIDRSRKNGETSLSDLAFEEDEDTSDIEFSSLLMVDGDDPESQFLKETIWNELFIALEKLPENQRQVFVWNELEDKSLRQIAEDTGENLKTIISRKGYALKHLRRRLTMLYQDLLDF